MGAFSSSIVRRGRPAAEETFVAAGTLFGNDMPRLVRLGDYRLEAYLDGILLVFTHSDVPGIIGARRHDLRQAQREHRPDGRRPRRRPAARAIGVLNLDAVPPAAALDEVSASPDIQSVRVIELPPAGQLPTWLQGIGEGVRIPDTFLLLAAAGG